MAGLEQLIPGLAEARALEQQRRKESWLCVEEPICGVEMAPLTLRRALYLSLAGNPYVSGAADDAEASHAAQFLWVCSQAFKAGAEKARRRFYRRIRRSLFPVAHIGIQSYLDAAFFDLPAGDARADGRPSYVDWVSSSIHRLAERYGWLPDAILDLPVRQIVALDRCALAADPDGAKRLSNPLSDRLIAEHLERRNAPKPAPAHA